MRKCKNRLMFNMSLWRIAPLCIHVQGGAFFYFMAFFGASSGFQLFRYMSTLV